MGLFRRKKAVPDHLTGQRRIDSQWSETTNKAASMWQAHPLDKNDNNKTTRQLIQISGNGAIERLSGKSAWKSQIAATKQLLLDRWHTPHLRSEALFHAERVADQCRSRLYTYRWPTMLHQFAESHNLVRSPISPEITNQYKFTESLTAIIASELMIDLYALHGIEFDAAAVSSHSTDHDCRIDIWRAWPENSLLPDKRFTFVSFEVGFRGSVLTLSQHSGTLWFQSRVLDELFHYLDGDESEPLTPFWRIEFANRYREYCADVHKLFTGTSPVPVPPSYQDNGATAHCRALLENQERAARFSLRYNPTLDSLIHFDLRSLHLGEGSRIGELIIASRETAQRTIHNWTDFSMLTT